MKKLEVRSAFKILACWAGSLLFLANYRSIAGIDNRISSRHNIVITVIGLSENADAMTTFASLVRNDTARS